MSLTEPVQISQALDIFTKLLREAAVPSAVIDAKLMIAHARHASLGELERDIVLNRHLEPEQFQQVQEWVVRRAKREPLQHILGYAPFRQLELHVGPGVFVPRPETELLVEYCLEFLNSADTLQRRKNGKTPIQVVDFGSGSGAIAISLAHEIPQIWQDNPENIVTASSEPAGSVMYEASIYAVEKSDEAFTWLTKNVQRYAASSPNPENFVHVLHNGMEEAFAQDRDRFWLIVSNPPYIPESAIPKDIEVHEYDPALALYSGEDGLDHVRILALRAQQLLEVDGLLIIEHGEEQAEAIRRILASAGLTTIVTQTDYTGRDRFTQARKMLR